MSANVTSPSLRARIEADLAGGELTLPMMPDVAARVNEAASNPTSTAASMARIIEVDPSLAARVMKIANSALYAGLSEMRDLDHAIGRIGTAMVVALVLGSAGRDIFRCDDPELRALLEQSWMRSVHAAALSRRLAAQTGARAEEGFLAGLLHSVGEPIVIQRVARLVESGRLEHPPRDELVAALAGVAPAAGARLLAEWGLPDLVVAAVEHREDPDGAAEPLRPSVWLVAMAAAIGAAIVAGRARNEGTQNELVARFQGGPLPVDLESIKGWIAVAISDGAELSRVL